MMVIDLAAGVTMDLDRICRMCSSTKSRLKSIFADYVEENLVQIISNVLQLSISSDDGLPPKVCKPCVNILIKIREYVEQFRKNDKTLRQMVFGSGDIDLKEEEGLPKKINQHCSLRKKSKLQVPNKSTNPLPIATKQESPNGKLVTKGFHRDDDKTTETETSDSSEIDSDSCNAPSELKRKGPKKLSPRTTKSDKSESPTAKKQEKIDNNRPKLNDHKCYICGNSESMGSAKALLEHLTVHMDMMPYTCTECVMETVVLKNVRSLNIHKKMHAQPVKCEYCDRRYNNYGSRNEHVKIYHLGETAPCPSTCEQCGKVCKSIAALKNHLRDHKLTVKCDYCGKVFHRMFNLREHVTRVHEKAEKYNCKICNKVQHSLETYNAHLKIHNAEKTYVCDLCPKKFYTASNLGLHKKLHAKNANYKPQKDWTSHYTVRHDVDRGKVYTCNHCENTKSGSLNAIIGHVKNHFKDIQCDQCEMKFTNMHKLKIHSVVHTRERNYRCEYCGKDFMYGNRLNHHIKNKHKPVDNGGDSLTLTVEPNT